MKITKFKNIYNTQGTVCEYATFTTLVEDIINEMYTKDTENMKRQQTPYYSLVDTAAQYSYWKELIKHPNTSFKDIKWQYFPIQGARAQQIASSNLNEHEKADYILDLFKLPEIFKDKFVEKNGIDWVNSQINKVKDIGGFAVCEFYEGKRLCDYALNANIMAFDIEGGDKNTKNVLDKWLVDYNLNYLIFNTHSHTEESPRYRLIVELSRAVNADEYLAISNYVSKYVEDTYEVDFFDGAENQIERYFIYGSRHIDTQLFVDKYLVGEAVDVDAILEKTTVGKRNTNKIAIDSGLLSYQQQGVNDSILDEFYDDFTKITYREMYADFIHNQLYCRYNEDSRNLDMQTFVGIMGAMRIDYKGIGEYFFNEHLTIYSPSLSRQEIANHWKSYIQYYEQHLAEHSILNDNEVVEEDDTNTQGDDKMSENKQIMQNNATKRLKSIILEEAKKCKKVVTQNEITKKIIKNNPYGLLSYSKDFYPKRTQTNLMLIFEEDKCFKDNIILNFFTHACEWVDTDKVALLRIKMLVKNQLLIDDDDINHIIEYIRTKYNVTFEPKLVWQVIKTVATQINPIQQYLDSLPQWDGKARVTTCMIDLFGADDIEVNKTITKKFFVGAVKRGITNTSTKFDTALILQSEEQGMGKSTFCQKLCFERRYFDDNVDFDMMKDRKRCSETIKNKWICELGEMNGILKQDVKVIKNFLSSDTDNYRAAYDTVAKDYPRHCVFIGTTNDNTLFNDITGNRRFLPIICHPDEDNAKKINSVMTTEWVAQFWAEAYFYYKQGVQEYLTVEEEKEVNTIRDYFMYEPDELALIEDFLDNEVPENYYGMSANERFMDFDTSWGGATRDVVTLYDILQEYKKIPRNQQSKKDFTEIKNVMKYSKKWKPMNGGKRTRLTKDKAWEVGVYYQRVK